VAGKIVQKNARAKNSECRFWGWINLSFIQEIFSPINTNPPFSGCS
jgi:16S rRNA G1207 methylase RsmC